MGLKESICDRFLCYSPQQDTTKKDILKFIKQFNQEIWYPMFKKIFKQSQINESDQVKYNLTILEGSQYDCGNLNQQESSASYTRLNKFQNYTPAQKESSLKQLIDKSYMVLDQQDFPESKDWLYPESARRNLFNDQYSTSTILSIHEQEETREKRFTKLKNFDPEVLKSFQRFVRFCVDVKQASTTEGNIICKLILNFKADMIAHYRIKTKAKLSESNHKLKMYFLITIRTFIYSMQQCLIMMYNLGRTAELQKQNTFFTEVNIHTFITSLIFSDPTFNDLVVKIYQITLKDKIQKFERKEFFRHNQIPPEYRLDNETVNYFKSYGRNSYDSTINRNIPSLFRPSRTADQPYFKCLKMLQRVFTFNQPIMKLKVVYQTALQIQRQITAFYRKNNIDTKKKMLDAEKFLEIVMYIMKKFENETIVVHMMIINDFIHEYYKNSKKGCFFAPFLISCEGESV